MLRRFCLACLPLAFENSAAKGEAPVAAAAAAAGAPAFPLAPALRTEAKGLAPDSCRRSSDALSAPPAAAAEGAAALAAAWSPDMPNRSRMLGVPSEAGAAAAPPDAAAAAPPPPPAAAKGLVGPLPVDCSVCGAAGKFLGCTQLCLAHAWKCYLLTLYFCMACSSSARSCFCSFSSMCEDEAVPKALEVEDSTFTAAATFTLYFCCKAVGCQWVNEKKKRKRNEKR